MIELIALHKHWCIADAVRIAIGAPLLKPDEKAEMLKRFGMEFSMLGEVSSIMARISVWYALLYVVVEGYKALKVEFEPVDTLLAQEDFVNLLRLFRNGTFHYQEDPLTEKVVGFLHKADSENWVRELNKQFQAFFLQALPIEETLKRLEGENASS